MIHELIFLVAVVIFIAIAWRHRRTNSIDELGIEGDLIWIDEGRHTKPFFNGAFKVFGKPDAIYRTRAGVTAVEYKSRNGPVFESDVTQAKCAALASRGEGYQVVDILVKTAGAKRHIKLPKSDRALYQDIEESVVLARRAKLGKAVPSAPSGSKCRSCAYREDCKHAAA